MTEPRTRTAAEVALAANTIGIDTHCRALYLGGISGSEPATLTQIRLLAGFVEDIAYLVEDLADGVAVGTLDKDPDWPEPPAPFSPVEWPLRFTCAVASVDSLLVENSPSTQKIFFTVDSDGEESTCVGLTANDARLLAHAILEALDGQ